MAAGHATLSQVAAKRARKRRQMDALEEQRQPEEDRGMIPFSLLGIGCPRPCLVTDLANQNEILSELFPSERS